MHKRLLVLGATGSIGTSTLQVIQDNPELFSVAAASSHTQEPALMKIISRYNIPRAALTGIKPLETQRIQYSGMEGLIAMIHETEADIVVNGISGAAGLRPSIAALESGKDLVLANKETVVMANSLIFDLAARHSCSIIPVDSEHSAILQLTRFRPASHIQSIILTASGGPFRKTPFEQFPAITPEEAIMHPTWKMGPKISIDSATLANKGLEIIETHMFFRTPPEKIEVIIHPQSIVHSLITTIDGCMYAQLSSTDMKIPIMNALMFPEIATSTISDFSLVGQKLTFERADLVKFPMLAYAYHALHAGGATTIAYNAANEVAVEHFMQQRIPFTGIPRLTELILKQDWSDAPMDLEEIFTIDAEIRTKSRELIETI